MVASSTRKTSYPALLISPIASAIRSDSERESLIAFPSSCMRCFNGSSTEFPLISGCAGDALRSTGGPPTRFDCSGARTRSQAFYRQFMRHAVMGGRGFVALLRWFQVNRQILHHGRQFLNHVVPAVVKPARTLWNEVIGFLFLCLAIIFGFNGV